MGHHSHELLSRTHCLDCLSALDLWGKTDMEIETGLPFIVPHGRSVS